MNPWTDIYLKSVSLRIYFSYAYSYGHIYEDHNFFHAFEEECFQKGAACIKFYVVQFRSSYSRGEGTKWLQKQQILLLLVMYLTNFLYWGILDHKHYKNLQMINISNWMKISSVTVKIFCHLTETARDRFTKLLEKGVANQQLKHIVLYNTHNRICSNFVHVCVCECVYVEDVVGVFTNINII